MTKTKFKNYQNKVHLEEQHSREELEGAVQDFLKSCHRIGNHDLDDNIRSFMNENDHIQLDEHEVRQLFKEIDEAEFSGLPSER